jgi:hypothetical protein
MLTVFTFVFSFVCSLVTSIYFFNTTLFSVTKGYEAPSSNHVAVALLLRWAPTVIAGISMGMYLGNNFWYYLA